jgi:hypothetical protein
MQPEALKIKTMIVAPLRVTYFKQLLIVIFAEIILANASN